MKPFLKLIPPVTLALAAAGCATPSPLMKTSALDAFKTIPNSAKAPCEMQRAVAAHNSVYVTLKTGKETVYSAPCAVDKKPVPASESKQTS